MGVYIIRRLVLFVPTAFGVSLFIFAMLHVIPGDAATARILGGRESAIFVEPGAFEEAQARVREQLGLDGSLPTQYLRWAGDALRIDLGDSFTNGLPVLDLMLPRIYLSAELGLLSVALAVLIAIPGGIIAAVRQDTWIDYLLRTVSMVFESMPNFWIALLLIIGLLWAFEWLPPLGYAQIWEDPWLNVRVLVFPALIIGMRSSAGLLRMTRSSVLEVLRDDYVRTARAKGLQPSRVLFVHVLQNALLPVVTLAGFEIVIQMGGQVIIENVFNLPGLGQMLVHAVPSRNYPVIQAIVMFLAVVVLAANLLVDLMYAWLDPRIRYT